MVTIKELAKECGVSTATVSNVINGKGRVGAETINKVLQTAEELSYVPNALAKSLKENNTKTIGVITEDLTVFNTPLIVDGINEYLLENGYNFLLGNLRLYKTLGNKFYHKETYKQEVTNQFKVLKGNRVEGIIYVGAHAHEIACIPDDLNIPIVTAYSYAKGKNIPAVVYDDEQAAFLATELLIQNGAERVGVILGEKESMHTDKRLQGYKNALDKYGIRYDEAYICEGDWTKESGYKATALLHQRGIQYIFSMNDEMAVGTYEFAYDNKLTIGKDLKIVGFDNREISKVRAMQLTTMDLPLAEIGRTAASKMLSMIQEGSISTDEKEVISLQCNKILRASV